MTSMKQDIKDYLYILQSISKFKSEFSGTGTPYAFETRRCELHNRIFETHIFPFLRDGTDYNAAYLRSKELFSRLDQIWRIYNAYPFDLNDNECIIQLAKDLDKFLLKTETLYYLVGVTAHIHGIDLDAHIK